MAMLKPTEARLIVRHYEDGRMRVLLDGKSIPGVTDVEVSQSGRDRAELKITIIGLAYRVEQSDLRSHDSVADAEIGSHVVAGIGRSDGVQTTVDGDRPPPPRR